METADLGLAAAIAVVTKEEPNIQSTENDKKKKFMFVTNLFDSLKSSYFKNQLTVSSYEYYLKIRELKDRLFNER